MKIRFFLTAGCCVMALVSWPVDSQGRPKRKAQLKSADEVMMVDCLLPGLVRRLGRQYTFATQRRPARTTEIDCRIRGGEYTAYDRADYNTALAVWLTQADSGNAEAQYYVGQIYEKGMGREPDYAKAAEWYQKAAEQAYSAAQHRLGFLYEQGLGVAQDREAALNWYHKASGLPEELIVRESDEYEELLAEHASRGQRLAQLDLRVAALQRQLEAERAKGGRREAEIQRLVEQLDRDRSGMEETVADYEKKIIEFMTKTGGAKEAPPGQPTPEQEALDPAAKIDFGPFRALVIANADYQHLDPLPWAIDAAKAVARMVEEQYGFEVEMLPNASREDILFALDDLHEELSESHNLLVFYVGHSTVEAKHRQSWWQPVDAKPDRQSTWILTRALGEKLGAIPAKHVLVVADAFYTGQLTRSSVPRLPPGISDEKRVRYIREMLDQRARLVLARGGTKKVDAAQPAAFMDAFVEVLRQNDRVLEATNVYRQLCTNLVVGGGEAGKLIPQFAPDRWGNPDGSADFFFVPRGKRAG